MSELIDFTQLDSILWQIAFELATTNAVRDDIMDNFEITTKTIYGLSSNAMIKLKIRRLSNQLYLFNCYVNGMKIFSRETELPIINIVNYTED